MLDYACEIEKFSEVAPGTIFYFGRFGDVRLATKVAFHTDGSFPGLVLFDSPDATEATPLLHDARSISNEPVFCVPQAVIRPIVRKDTVRVGMPDYMNVGALIPIEQGILLRCWESVRETTDIELGSGVIGSAPHSSRFWLTEAVIGIPQSDGKFVELKKITARESSQL